jgi:hypothetical protein
MINSIKLAFTAGLFAFGCYLGWYFTGEHYQKRISEIQLQTAESVQIELLNSADKRKTAEETHAKDQLTINHLRNNSQRVQIYIPCGNPLPTTDKTGSNTDRASGLLSNRVDEAFAEFQTGVGYLIQRCDQLNIDARQFNASTQP